jgi:hypothetical protein
MTDYGLSSVGTEPNRRRFTKLGACPQNLLALAPLKRPQAPVPSLLPERAWRPSGLKQTESTRSSWPSRTRVQVPMSTAHARTVPSPPLDTATRPSPETSTAPTSPLCPSHLGAGRDGHVDHGDGVWVAPGPSWPARSPKMSRISEPPSCEATRTSDSGEVSMWRRPEPVVIHQVSPLVMVSLPWLSWWSKMPSMM